MNIFFLSYDPRTNASLYCDAHVIKIILEITQMLYTAIHILNPSLLKDAPNGGYRKTHYNHPVAVWVRTSRSNWDWTIAFAFELCDEFTARGFGKNRPHACKRHLEYIRSIERLLDFPYQHFTTPHQAMPDAYREPDGNVIKAYTNYILYGKVFKNGKSASERLLRALQQHPNN